MRKIKFRAWDNKVDTMVQWDKLGQSPFLLKKWNLSWDYMQFTGKKDKKGIEIYDGDVLRWYPNKPVNHIDVIICWDEYTASFYFGDWYDNDFPDTAIDSLVIGNIYQNPELGNRT